MGLALLTGILPVHYVHTDHFVDSCDDLEHLPPGDEAVLVEVVHGEGPLQLVLQLAAGGDAQRAQKLPEVDGPVSVGVKCPEHVLSKLPRVAVREKVAVNLLELLHGQLAVGAIFEEAFVPFLNRAPKF